jgi:chaperone required for assembly of F1-ATPase
MGVSKMRHKSNMAIIAASGVLSLLMPQQTMSQTEPEITAAKKINGLSANVQITSLSESLIINSIEVNRGKCEIDNIWAVNTETEQYHFPVKLEMGEKLNVNMLCNPIELEIITTRGVKRIKWSN